MNFDNFCIFKNYTDQFFYLGVCGVTKLSDYCASKHAVCGLEESIKLELIRLGLDNVKSTMVI